MDRTWLPRLLGMATAAYGAAIFAKPELLLGPSGLLRGTAAEPEQAVFVRALAVRDLASGVAMAAAPSRAALRTAIGVRVAADVGDACVLGTALPPSHRRKVVAVAGGWALLCALSALTTRKR